MTAPAASSNNPTPSSIHANIIPSEVGWQFVPQYYTFVNKQPQKLHCFYTKNSTFIHGTEGEDGKPCYGQQEIHHKIVSIGFQDCKVFIHSVDAQSSANGGIIIQVIGEMSNRGEPWRKFAQTFFLAQQPNGYFVLNDIFRFLKEESVEDEEENEHPDPVPPPAAVAQENTVEPAAPAVQAGHPTVAASPYDSVLPNHLQQQSIPETLGPAEVVVMEEQKPTINGYHPPAPEPMPVIAPVPQADPIKQAPVPESSQTPPIVDIQRPVSPQIAPKPTPSPTPAAASPSIAAAAALPPRTTTPSQPSTSTSVPSAPPIAAAAVASKPAAAAVQPPAAPKPAAPKTWANLAAANSNKWGTQVAQDAKGVSAAPPTPVTPTAAPSPSQSRNEQRGGDREGRDMHPAYQAALNVSTPQCFVKGVAEVVSHQALMNALTSRFGPVKNLEIIRTKACAFLEFTTLDTARKAIIASLTPNAGGEGGLKIDLESGGHTRVIVETRKERSERLPPRPRTSGQGQQGQGQGQGQPHPHGQEGSGGPGGHGGHGGNSGGGGGGGFRGGAARGRGAGRGGKS